MNKRPLFIGTLVGLLVLLFSYQIASAHTTIHVGNYDVEVGWVDEPPIVGQRNAVVVNVSNTTNDQLGGGYFQADRRCELRRPNKDPHPAAIK